jgi:hypothetical protein
MMDLFGDIARTGKDAAPSRARWRDVYAREQASKRFDRLVDPDIENTPPAAPPCLNGEKRIILNAETTGLEVVGGDLPIGWSYILPESGRRGYLPMRHKRGANLPVEQVHDWLRRLRGMHVDNINTKFDLHMSRADDVDLVDQGRARSATPRTTRRCSTTTAALQPRPARPSTCSAGTCQATSIGKQPLHRATRAEFQDLHAGIGGALRHPQRRPGRSS